MKVRIRKYRWHWICNHWPFNKLSDWYDKHRVSVKYDPWDTWNLDYTLAVIILPGLKQLKETNHGMPWVDDEDVPEELAWPGGKKAYFENIGTPLSDVEYQTREELMIARWDYVQDEMIYAFERIIDGEWESKYFNGGFDKYGYEKENERISKGLILFGKYYRSLWD